MIRGGAGAGVLAAAAAGLVLSGTGCSALLEPSREEATAWALESLDGAALPAVSMSNEWVTMVTRADTLRFGGRTRGLQIVHWDAAYASPEVADETGRMESEFSYRIVQGRVEISFDCPPNALCLAPPHLYAVPVAGALRVQPVGGGAVRIYRRAAP